MPKSAYRRVIVAGDLLVDHHIARWPEPVSTHSAAGNRVLMTQSPGGAYYLADMIKRTTAGTDLLVVGPSHGKVDELNEAYQTWEPCKKEPGKKAKDKVWRTTEFLGCRRAVTPESCQPSVTKVGKSDILVIDNLGLDFTSDGGAWEVLAKTAQQCGHVILKTSTLNIVSDFFTFLRTKLAAKTTLIVTAGTLRERGAVISDGLSWDRTIEDLIEAFSPRGSLHDIGGCARVVVRFGLSGVAVLSRSSGDQQMRQKRVVRWPTARLVRFIYDAQRHEGLYTAPFEREGGIFGASSILTAALVRHTADPESFPLHIACTRALETARRHLRTGAGDGESGLDFGKLDATVAPDLAPDGRNDEANGFRCSFSRTIEEGTGESYGFDPKGSTTWRKTGSRILRDVAGAQAEAVASLATEVVLWGAEKALAEIPKVKYGHYLSVDREEIERINAFRRAVLAYRDNPKDKNPLSIAVFGPPGSGKSFAIKQVMGTIFGKDREATTFNMSQLRDTEELNAALHQVHDETVRGAIPLIFFDEFDAEIDGKLGWLKHFLAPMQDAEFWDGKALHPLGKAIFIFAGGRYENFADFDEKVDGKYSKEKKASKVPDFISRLRGYIDVKGPNCVSDLDSSIGTHRIRRAIMLRYQLEQFCPQIIDPRSGYAAVGLDVIRAFLFADEYQHGARSISALISTSRLGAQNCFTLSCLPTRDVMCLHVSEDFLPPPRPELYDAALVEDLAKACHESWRRAKTKAGYAFGETRNDDRAKGPLLHPRLMPYEKLSEEWKEDNRKPSRLFLVKADTAGFHLEHASGPTDSARGLFRVTKAMEITEHDFWVRDHLVNGHEYAARSRDDLRLHRSLQLFATLAKADRELDRAIVASAPVVLKARGYRLVRKT